MTVDFDYRPSSYAVENSDWSFYGRNGVMIESSSDSYVGGLLQDNQRDIVYFGTHDYEHGGSWHQVIRATKVDDGYCFDFIDIEDRIEVPTLHSELPLTFKELTDFISAIPSKYSEGNSWMVSKWSEGLETAQTVSL